MIEHEAVGVISQVCSAIRFMHRKGIVHRDLKPENVMLKYKEDLSHVKLIDFGMSKLFGPGENMTRSRLGTLVVVFECVVTFHEITHPSYRSLKLLRNN